jgi:hypothetical protein
MSQQAPTIDQIIREVTKHQTAISQLNEMIATELQRQQADNVQLRARVAELDKPKKK